MNRLYDIKYDKNIWDFKGNHSYGYQIKKMDSLEKYFLDGDIIGLEQITSDCFLIYYKLTSNEGEITRLKLKKGRKTLEYSHRFRNFSFLNDDIIIFDKDSLHSANLYSISRNCEISSLNFLISPFDNCHDCQFCKSREIELIYDDEKSKYPTYLHVDYELIADYCKEFIQLFIDPITFLPLPRVYSTLRKEYIHLSDNFTLKMLFEDHNAKLKIIDNFLLNLYFSDNRKKEAELCSEILNN